MGRFKNVDDWFRGRISRHEAIIGQGIWVFLGQALTAILTLAGTRITTQFVDPRVYGVVNLVQNALVLLRTLFCSPVMSVALRYYPDAERGNYLPALRLWLRHYLTVGVLMMEAVAIVGGLVWSRNAQVNPWIVLILVVFVVADVGRSLEMTLFSASRRQRPTAIVSAAETFMRPLLIVGAVILFGASVEVVLFAITASVVFTILGIYVGVRREAVHGGTAIPPSIANEMWRYAVPLIPIALLNWTTSVSDRYLIQWLSHDTSAVGVYSAGYGLISQPFMIIHGVVALTLRPAYFAAVSRDDRGRAAAMFRGWLTITASITLVATGFIFLTRNILVAALLGPQYRGAVVVVPWIALGYLFYVMEQVLEQHLLAHKRTSAVLTTQTCGALASIVVTIPFVATLGMIGAAYACPIYFLIQCLLAAAFVLRTIPGAPTMSASA
jgi:O-antigen/teichoic acid export membrane protein